MQSTEINKQNDKWFCDGSINESWLHYLKCDTTIYCYYNKVTLKNIIFKDFEIIENHE